MGDIAAALRMLDIFASVGAQSFVVTKTDLLENLKLGKHYTLPHLREKLPSMVAYRSHPPFHPVTGR